MSDVLCRCGSQFPFVQCCEPLLNNTKQAHTAEQLMRSRFTAFCLHKFKYLVDTHHITKQQPNELSDLQTSSQQTSWMRLTIHKTTQGSSADEHGCVEFSAFFNENEQTYELRETSSFVQQNGRWFYLTGSPKVTIVTFKLKRNEACWCFSGKKFKHCHA